MTSSYITAITDAEIEEVVLETLFEMGWSLLFRTSDLSSAITRMDQLRPTHIVMQGGSVNLDRIPAEVQIIHLLPARALREVGQQKSMASKRIRVIEFRDHPDLRIQLRSESGNRTQSNALMVALTSTHPNAGRTHLGLHLIGELSARGISSAFGATNPGDLGADRILGLVAQQSLDGGVAQWRSTEIFPGGDFLHFCLPFRPSSSEAIQELKERFRCVILDVGENLAPYANERRERIRNHYEVLEHVDRVLLLGEDSPKGIARVIDVLGRLDSRVPPGQISIIFNRSNGKGGGGLLFQSRGFSIFYLPDAPKELAAVEAGEGLVGERERRSPYRRAILEMVRALSDELPPLPRLDSTSDESIDRRLGRSLNKRSSRTF